MATSYRLAERLFQAAIALLAFAFLASAIFALCYGHVTVTAFDMWHLYDVALNKPFWQAALLKYGTHSLFFPSLIWLTDVAYFRNDQQLLFWTGLLLLILSAALLVMAVWRDSTTGLTAKLVAILVLMVANFSMARASITAIGAFNCICSLVVVAAVIAFHSLAAICHATRSFWPAMILLLTTATVASFSFGSGFAAWPTLLLLGWSARLSWRTLAMIAIGGLMAAIIYKLTPGPAPTISSDDVISITTALRRLCSLLGTPFLYATAAWKSTALSPAAAQYSIIPVVCGAVGLVLAAIVVLPRLIRRDLGSSELQFFAVGLTLFNLIAIGFIVVGRTAHMHASPGEAVAPRYMFWSFLFWAGLFLAIVREVDSRDLAKWPAFLLLSTLPVLAFPQHWQGARWARFVQLLMESGATGLINGVCDIDKVKVMYPDPPAVCSLAQKFRRLRLDMFAEGLQDWIGAPETKSFPDQYRSVDLQGAIAVQSLVDDDHPLPAARVTGWAIQKRKRIPKQLVFTDPKGIICGLALPTEIRTDINRRYNFDRFAASGFLGYISNYDSRIHYRVRSVDEGQLSKETLVVATPPLMPDRR